MAGGTGVLTPGEVAGLTAIAALGAVAVEKCIQTDCLAKPNAFRYSTHHIIAQYARAALFAREIWTINLGESINADPNLVDLPNYMHWYLHTQRYYVEVNVLIGEAYSIGLAHGDPLDTVENVLHDIADVLSANDILSPKVA